MDAVLLFCELGTQWRVVSTMAGAVHTGLDYAAATAVLNLRELRPAKRRRLFADLRTMEQAALAAWGEQREAAAVAREKARVS